MTISNIKALIAVSIFTSGFYSAFGAAGTWTGTTSTDWNTAGNWSGGVPSAGNATINTSPANICTVTANPSATPVDILVGRSAGTGRVDLRAGTLSTGAGNWCLIGSGGNTGNGILNIANTGSAGTGLTGFAQGSGSLTAGTLQVGGAWFGDGGTGLVRINTTGTITTTATGLPSLSVGEAVGTGVTGNGELDLESGTILVSGQLVIGQDDNTANAATGVIKMTGGTLNLTNAVGPNYIGYHNGIGTLLVTNGTVNSAAEMQVGGSADSGSYTGSGTLTTYGGSVNLGSLTVSRANSTAASYTGTVNVNGGTVTSTNDVIIGFAGGGTGTINLNGGTLNVGTTATKWFQPGVWDTTIAVINLTNGNLNLNSGSSIKFNSQTSSGAHTFSQYGGAVTFYSDFATTVGGAGTLDFRVTAGSTGVNTYNLNGGTLTVPQIIATAATGTRVFNFNGGTLKPAATSASFFASGVVSAANVRNNASTIDNNGKAITIGQVLQHSAVGGDNATDGGLTFADSGAAATTTLTGANTYNGDTVISGGTLALGTGGSLASSNIIVNSGKTFDVSGITYTVAANQALRGFGTVTGSVTLNSSTSLIKPGNTSTIGTLAFATNLTLTTGSATFRLSTSASTGNDKVTVAGNLSVSSSDAIHISALSGAANLDTSADYVLFSVAGTTTMSSTPVLIWDGTTPTNYLSYSVQKSGNNVVLHFTPATGPTVTATASPSTAARNQNITITATVTPGSGTVTNVQVDVSQIGGSSTVSLVLSGLANVYTNTFAATAGTAVGAKSFTISVTDTTPLSGSYVITPVNIVATNVTWNGGGADNNWSSNPNWSNGAAPGYSGDAITFTGTARTAPNMNTNYGITGLTFDSSAGAFTIGTTTSSTLTNGAGGVVNNSANLQTLNVPVILNAAQTINAATGSITLGSTLTKSALLTVAGASNTIIAGTVTGSGGLTKIGNGTLTIGGTYSASGFVQVNAGKTVLAASVTPASDFSIGEGTGTTGAVDIVTGGSVSMPSTWYFVGHNNGTGVLNLSGNASMSLLRLWAGGATFGDNGVGTVNIDTTGSILGTDGIFVGEAWSGGYGSGIINLTNGTLTSSNEIWVGGDANPGSTNNGTINQSGGSVSSAAWLAIGRGGSGGNVTGTYNLSGGTVTAATSTVGSFATIGSFAGVTGTLNVSGGTFLVSASRRMYVGEGGTGTLNISATGLVICSNTPDGGFRLGVNSGASGTVNLNGGTLMAALITQGSGSGTFNFNGGTLMPTLSTNAYLQGLTRANVRDGGAIIDSSGSDITIGQALLHSNLGGDSATDGGLTKRGNGILTLSATNTYTGNTAVNGGTLALSGAGSIANSPNITITAGACFTVANTTLVLGQTLVANAGTASVSGNLNLGAAALVLNYTNGTPALQVTNGNLTFSNNAVTITVSGTQLASGNYKLISTNNAGGIVGTLPSSVTVNGAGAAHAAKLQVINGELYLVVNTPPVAGTLAVIRPAGLSLKLAWSDLATNWSDANADAIALNGISLTTTNGVTLLTNATWILYTNNLNVSDQFSYTIIDAQGDTATGVVNISINGSITGTNSIASVIAGSPTALIAYGIPGYSYITQRSTNLADWVDISTNVAATNGVISVTDSFSDLGAPPSSAYYRMKWQP